MDEGRNQIRSIVDTYLPAVTRRHKDKEGFDRDQKIEDASRGIRLIRPN